MRGLYLADRRDESTTADARSTADYIVLPLPDLTNGTSFEIVPQGGNDPLYLTGISASKCAAEANPIP